MPGCKHKAKQAHHIRRWADYVSLRYDVTNGISLCWDCHKKIWNRELYYVEIFTRIVRNKK
ncbi:MAG: HNH endonuclease [Candidatus Thorarchaeota archaeon]